MTSNTIKVRRIGIFSSGFQLLFVLAFLYLIFYLSRRFSIPVIGTVAKWILIIILGIFALIVGILLLIFVVAIFAIIIALLRNAAVKRRYNKIYKKDNVEDIEEKIRVLNPSTSNNKNKEQNRKKSNVVKKKGDIIVDAEYK